MSRGSYDDARSTDGSRRAKLGACGSMYDSPSLHRGGGPRRSRDHKNDGLRRIRNGRATAEAPQKPIANGVPGKEPRATGENPAMFESGYDWLETTLAIPRDGTLRGRDRDRASRGGTKSSHTCGLGSPRGSLDVERSASQGGSLQGSGHAEEHPTYRATTNRIG